MTSIASLEELKEMRKVYIGLLYNAKDEKKISYLIKELGRLFFALIILDRFFVSYFWGGLVNEIAVFRSRHSIATLKEH